MLLLCGLSGSFISKKVCPFIVSGLDRPYRDIFPADVSQGKNQGEIYLQPSVVCVCFHLLITKWQNPAHPDTDSLRRETNGGKGA